MVHVQTATAFFRVHDVLISLGDCPFTPSRDIPLVAKLVDPRGSALSMVFNARVSGHEGQHLDWKGTAPPGELSSSPGMLIIRGSVPSGTVALILNFYSDKSDINAT